MNFHFDIDKSISATAYLLRKNGGREEVLFLVKMLYDANRESLLRYGRSLTGDAFSSMEHGPIVSETYDLLKGNLRVDAKFREKWGQFISPRNGNSVHLVNNSEPELLHLAKREIALLDESFDKIKSVRGRISDWSHRVFPEWEQVPPRTSKTLPAERIFEKQNTPAEEIDFLKGEIDNLTWLQNFLVK